MPAVPPAEYKWKKGQSGNPHGRPPIPAGLRNVLIMTTDIVKRTISKYLEMDHTKLDACLANPKLPAFDAAIISILKLAIEKGDFFRMNFLLDRTVGKVKDVMEIIPPTPVVIEKLDGSQEILDVKAIES